MSKFLLTYLLTYDDDGLTVCCVSEPEVRFSVLVSLDEKFDPHLAQAENLAALFIALKDEVFEIRELAVCIIGRLCSINPAYVMPFLRKVLIEVCWSFVALRLLDG